MSMSYSYGGPVEDIAPTVYEDLNAQEDAGNSVDRCFGPNDGGSRGMYNNKCYQSAHTLGGTCALYDAVRDYKKQGCATNPNCPVAKQYGWPMNAWCVDSVKSMSSLFEYLTDFNEDISDWQVGNVIDAQFMFKECWTFKADISRWDVSKVENFYGMFQFAAKFNSDLSGWDISSATDMNYMLEGATLFNHNMCHWSDKFPYDNAKGIFLYTNCTYGYSDPPMKSNGGPFCASKCTTV